MCTGLRRFDFPDHEALFVNLKDARLIVSFFCEPVYTDVQALFAGHKTVHFRLSDSEEEETE